MSERGRAGPTRVGKLVCPRAREEGRERRRAGIGIWSRGLSMGGYVCDEENEKVLNRGAEWCCVACR